MPVCQIIINDVAKIDQDDHDGDNGWWRIICYCSWLSQMFVYFPSRSFLGKTGELKPIIHLLI